MCDSTITKDYDRLKFIVGKEFNDSLKSQINLCTTQKYDICDHKQFSIVTADYRPNRLRVYLNDNKVVSYTIG